MSEVEISAARSLDAGAVGAVISAANDAVGWLPRVHSRAEEIGLVGEMIEAGWVDVAHQGSRIVGFLSRAGGEIHGLYLVPKVQRRGIGSALLDKAKAEADTLRLWTYQGNVAALRFYRRHGFHAVQYTEGQGNEAGLPDVRLEWTRRSAHG